MEMNLVKMELMKKKKKKGFTLIELIVVIAILGVLAAIAVPSYSKYITNAKSQRTILDNKTVSKAIQAYAASNDMLPADVTDAQAATLLDFTPSTAQMTAAKALIK